jgi:hypothetical protein
VTATAHVVQLVPAQLNPESFPLHLKCFATETRPVLNNIKHTQRGTIVRSWSSAESDDVLILLSPCAGVPYLFKTCGMNTSESVLLKEVVPVLEADPF